MKSKTQLFNLLVFCTYTVKEIPVLEIKRLKAIREKIKDTLIDL